MNNDHKVSPTLTLLALAISAFAIGSTEFISVGVMPLIIKTFGISLSTAGLTVSVYAAGVMIGAPLLTAVTSSIPRKRLLMLIMATFIAGNLLTAIAPNFAVLLVGRVVASFAHGLFMSIGTVIAANVVAPDRRASAIATLFTGLTVATVTGVPLGTFIGQHATWRISFIIIALIGVIGAIANFILVPAALPMPAKLKSGAIMRMVRQPKLVLALLVTAIGYGASFPVYTYLTTILTKQGWSASASVIILIAYGLAVAFGNTMGGKIANKRPLKALLGMFTALMLVMVLMNFTLMDHTLGLISILILGVFAFMNVPGLQLFTVQTAEEVTPDDVQLASAFNISAFNLGIMVGSFGGGLVVANATLAQTPLAGILFAVAAMALTGVLMVKESKAAMVDED